MMRVLAVLCLMLGAALARSSSFYNDVAKPLKAQDNTIVQLATKLGATELVKLLAKADLTTTLEGTGPFTVFAPTDAAFEALPKDVRDQLFADLNLLTMVLKYHVVGSKVMAADIKNELTVPSLQGAMIRTNIYQDGKVITATGSQVTMADQLASNGVIHVIDRVMFPLPLQTVVGEARKSPAIFSTLLSALEIADLVEFLKGPGPFTVFAPTDAAFAKIPKEELDKILANKELLTAVLKYHVLASTEFSKGLVDGANVATLQGSTVKITITTDMKVKANDATVQRADVAVTNGVIHVIDTVLMPSTSSRAEETVIDLAKRLGATELVRLVSRAGLTSALAGPGPFTVFGPTNAAFEALPKEVLDMLEANMTALQEVLKYHVVGSKVMATDITNEGLLTTLTTEKIRTNIYQDGSKTVITATGSQVTLADQEASNGVIHVIDRVMYPLPTGTVVDLAMETPTLSTLVTALQTASLTTVLAGTGPFTVFAPTDAAFAKIPRDQLEHILANRTLLTAILKYHVIGSTVFSKGLVDGADVTTLEGQTVKVTITDGTVTINNAMVARADLAVTNGVVHLIDTVLIPPTLTLPATDANIVELAKTLGATTLLDLVTRAELTTTLTGTGPFTVFAPTNAAFKMLPRHVIGYLQHNKTALQEILKYHVIGSKVMSTDLTNDLLTPSLEGDDIRANIYQDGKVITVTGSRVTTADQEATNGVIHVINRVMYHLPMESAADLVVNDPAEFGILLKALTIAELTSTLNTTGPFTVFAPTDKAFEKIPRAELEKIINNKEYLTAILKYHVIGSTQFSQGLVDGADVTTLEGQTVKVTITDGTVRINTAMVERADLAVTNGVVHVIDTVLIPPTDLF